MPVRKIISGGQIGADIAGLRAGFACGLETGGWCPKGWKTKTGSNPGLGVIYGLVEHSSGSYPPRTFMNVKSADATVRFATNFESAGERCTLKAIRQYHKPYLDVPFVLRNGVLVAKMEPSYMRAWLSSKKVEVLNVAGNALPDLEAPVFEFLCEVIV